MNSSIEFINHASCVISGKSISILSDPWYFGDAFNKGWNLLYENDEQSIANLLDRTSYIWISHEHPDHFSIPFFKKFAQQINKNSITVLFQDTRDNRVISFLKSLSIQSIELKPGNELFLENDFSVTCIKDGFYDSALLVNNAGEKILNLNDCEITSPNRANQVHAITGDVDILLTQFSYAAWKGGVANEQWRQVAAQEKLETIELQIRIFKPKKLIPFASYMYFSNKENFYLNDSSNKPEALLSLNQTTTEIVIMKPGDCLAENTKINISESIQFWQSIYNKLSTRQLNKYPSIDKEVLLDSYSKYCKRISEKNSIIFMKFLRFISPMPIFSKVSIKLSDLDICYEFDYLYQTINETYSKPQISMSSNSLNFIFQNSFGFDTLTVNGCFEEESRNGFLNSSKTLAIENLNNMGFKISPSIILNLNLILLFLKRLIKVKNRLKFNQK